jgi:hypothetical protein
MLVSSCMYGKPDHLIIKSFLKPSGLFQGKGNIDLYIENRLSTSLGYALSTSCGIYFHVFMLLLGARLFGE